MAGFFQCASSYKLMYLRKDGPIALAMGSGNFRQSAAAKSRRFDRDGAGVFFFEVGMLVYQGRGFGTAPH